MQARLLAAALLTAVWMVCLHASDGIAQPQISANVGASSELLETRIKEVEASAELDEATAAALLELYRRAASFNEEARSHKAAADDYARAREEAPEEARAVRAEFAELEAADAPLLTADLRNKPLAELEQQLLSEKANLDSLEAQLSELDELLELQTPNANQARERLTAAKTRLAAVADELKVSAPEDELPQLIEARRWALENEARALSAEIERLDQALLSQPMRMELRKAQSDKTALEIKRLTALVQSLEEAVVERRRAEAEIARQEAAATQAETQDKHPLVKELAERNTQLGEQLNEIADDLERINKRENRASEEAKRVADNFRLARQQLEIAGLSQVLGQVLLEQSRNLPDASDFSTAERRRDEAIVESSLRQIRHQQERGQLRDIAGYVDTLLENQPTAEQLLLREELVALAESRRELIDKAIAADDSFLQALGELDHAQRQLSETVEAYDAFLDERLLWIRSGEPPSWDTAKSVASTLSIFWSGDHWRQLGQAFVRPAAFPWLLLLGVGGFLVLQWKARALRRALRNSGSKVGELRHDRFVHTLQAIGWTLALALPWPLLFVTLGLHLQTAGNPGEPVSGRDYFDPFTWDGQFVPAVGAAFASISLITFYFAAFRMLCKPSGLAVVHFGWDAQDTSLLRHEIRRLMFVFVPVAFIYVITLAYDQSQFGGGMSRLSFTIVMGALIFFFARILAPRTGALRRYYATNPSRPLTLLRHIWLGLGFAVPIALAGFALAGFVYTATIVTARLVDTLWLILALIFTHQLIVRWLLLTARRLAFRDALERNQQMRTTREAQEQEGGATESTPLQVEEPQVDYQALSEDTKKLIKTALILVGAFVLWAIWVDVLPAFRILDEVNLWHYSVIIDGAEKSVPITLTDGILALLIGIVGVVAARTLPSLLEFALLPRLNISTGSRHAIATLTQYTIVATGLVLLFNILGGSWSEIQWLIAALGVGIGFGLQEIVANFISGLILLFERPIRIGDVVTVGNTDGVVTRIRIRSTTVRNWDQQELVVPNKEFITGRLLNWTLSDPITRIVIPVGIAYGSDVARALELIDQAAREHERVLDEPQPLVTFESFGDNALTMMLRCYVGSMEYRLPTTSELNQSINRKFEEAGIVVAFPQRDIHLDTAQPLDVRIHRVETPGRQDVEQSRLHPVGDLTPKPTGSG